MGQIFVALLVEVCSREGGQICYAFLFYSFRYVEPEKLLFASVPYTFDLLSKLSHRFIFFLVRISKDPKHVTYKSPTSLISAKMLFLQRNTISSNCIWWTAVVQCAKMLHNHYMPPSASQHESLTL